jgi:hypothetical protein
MIVDRIIQGGKIDPFSEGFTGVLTPDFAKAQLSLIFILFPANQK